MKYIVVPIEDLKTFFSDEEKCRRDRGYCT